MPEQSETQRELQTLEAELKKLEAEYNMFFAGRLPRPPLETRSRVEAMVKRWDRGHIESAADRFRFQRCCRRDFRSWSSYGIAACARVKRDGRVRSPSRSRRRRQKRTGRQKVRHVTAFTDPMREMDKLHALYDTLMDARRQIGDDVVPFHQFAALVEGSGLEAARHGSAEVAFRVAVKEGKVNFTVRGVKGTKERGSGNDPRPEAPEAPPARFGI